MQFINELHKNTRFKIRIIIALFLLPVAPEAKAYLAYVIITEIFRYMSRRENMGFLNSFTMKIIVIMALSAIFGFLFKTSEKELVWVMIIACIIIALIIEQPFKLFVMLRAKLRREKAHWDYEKEHAEKERESKAAGASSENPKATQKIQYKVSACPSCGYKNKIIEGEVESCDYCGCPID